MLLGHARGKVGSLVFSRSNGQQIVRSRAEVVKNPQTRQQMIQRILMNTIAQAYSAMKVITDHSFEGVQAGQATMSAFISANLKSLRERVAAHVAAGGDLYEILDFSPVGTNYLAANEYIVSKGQLPAVTPAYVTINTVVRQCFDLDENTYAGVLAKYGLQRGDQLTFIGMNAASVASNARFEFARVILDPRNADGTEADLTSTFISNGAINLASPRNEGEFGLLQFQDSKVVWQLEHFCQSSAIIVSRKNEQGIWLRSNASIVKSGSSIGNYSLADALDMLSQDAIGTLNSRYLNNAGTSRLVNTTPVSENPSIATLMIAGQSIARGAEISVGDIASLNGFGGTLSNYNGQSNVVVALVSSTGTTKLESFNITEDGAFETAISEDTYQTAAGDKFVLKIGGEVVETYATFKAASSDGPGEITEP